MATRNKSSLLSLRAWDRHHRNTIFICVGKVRSKHRLLNWFGMNIWLSAMWGMASTMWHIDAVCLPWIGSEVVISRGCKAMCGNYWRVCVLNEIEFLRGAQFSSSSTQNLFLTWFSVTRLSLSLSWTILSSKSLSLHRAFDLQYLFWKPVCQTSRPGCWKTNLNLAMINRGPPPALIF